MQRPDIFVMNYIKGHIKSMVKFCKMPDVFVMASIWRYRKCIVKCCKSPDVLQLLIFDDIYKV